MITELYTFAPGSFVVADEWNANFRVLYNINLEHKDSIVDAYNEVAFPDSDLSSVFTAVNNKPNSSQIPEYAVTVGPQQEYYKTLANGRDLVINIPVGLNSESRVLIRTQNDRSLIPFSVNYSGTKIINHDNNNVYRAGYYYIMIYETNNVAQIKLIWTGA